MRDGSNVVSRAGHGMQVAFEAQDKSLEARRATVGYFLLGSRGAC